jgi:hypothetical protein
MHSRNYLLSLTRLLSRRKWHSIILWKMIDMIVEDLIDRDDNTLSYSVFKEIYSYAKNCKSLTELEDFLDKFSY